MKQYSEKSLVFPEDTEAIDKLTKEIQDISEQIKQALVSDGKYKATQDIQIEIAARDFIQYRRLSNLALTADPYLTEKTRENHTKITINPIFGEAEKYSKRLAMHIASLCMNVKEDKTIKNEPDNNTESPLQALMEQLRSEDE